MKKRHIWNIEWGNEQEGSMTNLNDITVLGDETPESAIAKWLKREKITKMPDFFTVRYQGTVDIF